MFKKKEKPRKDHSGKTLAQYGLFDIPTDFDTGGDNIEDEGGDSDLEAELAALAGNDNSGMERRRNQRVMPQNNLDSMVAESMKDVDDDDDGSVDENDPDLLGELNEITGEEEVPQPTGSPEKVVVSGNNLDAVKVLTERLKNYELAENNAKSSGETSKAKRYGRAMKTLKSLLSQAQRGQEVNLSDDSVPPEIHMDSKQAPNEVKEIAPEQPVLPSRPAPAVPTRDEPTVLPQSVQDNVENKKQDIDQELLDMLAERQKAYKIAALKAKKSDDAASAVKYVKIARQFDSVIAAVQSGQPVDLSKMPGPPEEFVTSPTRAEPKVEESEAQQGSALPEITVPEEAHNLPEQTLITASTVLEALEQRLAVYKDHESKAKEEGNSSKARRHGRIVKQFEQAIKLHKAGKPIPTDELPTPPGYAPIPIEGGAAPAAASILTPQPDKMPGPAGPSTPRSPPQNDGEIEERKQKPSPSSRISGNQVTTTHADKQVLILLAKQKQFKLAALNAKKQGEIIQAKEYLRQAKGFDKLLDAATSGLPVDWSSIPVSPEAKSQLDNQYDIAMSTESNEDSTGDSDVLARLENQLQKQLKMCLSTRDHNKALGDVAGTNRFERLALNVTKDMDVVRVSKRSGHVPKFHYEMKDFSIVKSFTDIMDNQMEVTIHRGINYQSENPKDIDTYVKIEFPFPQETPFSDRTSTIRDTNNPEYSKTFVIPIQRSSRQCQRVFKRHSIKCDIYSKGFWKEEKKVGGKLEVQIRLRTPIVTQQVEKIQEKWLVVDQ